MVSNGFSTILTTTEAISDRGFTYLSSSTGIATLVGGLSLLAAWFATEFA
jgi:hypothetical protein